MARQLQMLERVDVRSPDECWPCAGAHDKDGYRWFKVSGRQVYAHRFMLEAAGITIPAGAMVLHSCDNPPCVNPRHLRVGTHMDNMRDRHVRGRTARLIGDANANTRLSDATVRAIRAAYARGGGAKAVAARFGTTATYVYKIANYRKRAAA